MNDTQNTQENGNQNPYSLPREMIYGASGKKISIGLGVASMVLGLISLLMFYSFINVFLSILAIVFGIIQIATCEKKWMAVVGIVTAIVSVVLMVGSYRYIFSNDAFIQMLQEEFLTNNDIESIML